ncbi:MAG: RidA family protein [Gammaproteobacteria bacterium]
MLKIKNIALLFVLIIFSLNINAEPTTKKNHSAYRKAGDFIFISSLSPVDPITKQLPHDAEVQVKTVFEKLRVQVLELGAKMTDVVKVTVYMDDMDTVFPLVDKWMSEYFTEEPYPARTPLNMSFGSRGYKVVVDAIVYMEPKSSGSLKQ